MKKSMKVRIAFGTIMIVLLVGVFWLDGYLERQADPIRPVVGIPLAGLMLLLTGLAVAEMAAFCAGAGVRILPFSALIGSGFLGTLPFWAQMRSPSPPSGEFVLLMLGATLLAVFAEQMIRSRTQDAIRSIACTALTILYLSVGAALMLAIRLTSGLGALILFLAAVKCTDIGAYFTGSAVGRHKMIPWLSPGKTWEGLLGGLAAAAGVSVGIAAAVPGIPLAPWQAAVFGAVVGLFGQFADLCESLLKRSADVKDSGSLVPEFGGVLDILDSPLLAAPVGYMMLKILH